MSISHTDRSSERAVIDIINILSVAILLVITSSTAAVVGAAVFSGEFDDRGLQQNQADDDTPDRDVSVDTQSTAVGTTVTWTNPGDAAYVEIRDTEGNLLDTLQVSGQEKTVDQDQIEVYAIYEDGTETQIYQAGEG
ncbi:hypothetical protein DM826_10380 [Halonotius aquaticus]|uniref:Uncharacterized protein n=1 Tax=Halonotius aquaticus TaxID=2216978 RepID=A0A3A6Q489_9EURY|nr:hypothetical protein [Halonotius aquaticus]RJX42055.1 hypothetical protein DM826_10380 [Halonotius aquaticus]